MPDISLIARTHVGDAFCIVKDVTLDWKLMDKRGRVETNAVPHRIMEIQIRTSEADFRQLNPNPEVRLTLLSRVIEKTMRAFKLGLARRQMRERDR